MNLTICFYEEELKRSLEKIKYKEKDAKEWGKWQEYIPELL